MVSSVPQSEYLGAFPNPASYSAVASSVFKYTFTNGSDTLDIDYQKGLSHYTFDGSHYDDPLFLVRPATLLLDDQTTKLPGFLYKVPNESWYFFITISQYNDGYGNTGYLLYYSDDGQNYLPWPQGPAFSRQPLQNAVPNPPQDTTVPIFGGSLPPPSQGQAGQGQAGQGQAGQGQAGQGQAGQAPNIQVNPIQESFLGIKTTTGFDVYINHAAVQEITTAGTGAAVLSGADPAVIAAIGLVSSVLEQSDQGNGVDVKWKIEDLLIGGIPQVSPH